MIIILHSRLVTKSHLTLLTVDGQVTLWDISRQEYWSELLFPSPEVLPNPGIEPKSPAW